MKKLLNAFLILCLTAIPSFATMISESVRVALAKIVKKGPQPGNIYRTRFGLVTYQKKTKVGHVFFIGEYEQEYCLSNDLRYVFQRGPHGSVFE